MDKETIELLRKFIANQCSAFELKQVEKLLKEGRHTGEWGVVLEELAVDQFLNPASESVHPEFDQQQLLGRIQQSAGIKQKNKWYPFAWTAAAACLLLAGAALLFIIPQHKQKGAQTLAAVSKKAETFNHRLLKLADGSTVLLNDSSTLTYPEKFSGSTREVTLTGEAYFDIEHDSAHPFIIHTGELTTTVLGTAFNIRAFKNEKNITVTVTRGKVSVQKGKQLLGILTPDQQISYDLPAATHQQQIVNADKALTWKQHDLILDDVTLEEAAILIAKQYGKKVNFANNNVKSCQFSASFLNRNTLEQVLSVVGEITNTSLSIKNDVIEINGKGCQ